MIKKVCDVCGKETDDYLYTADGEVVCAHCKYNLHMCSCGSLILQSKVRCNSCEENLYKRDINPYSTKPIAKFKNYYTHSRDNFKKQRYYGFEMEFNNCNPQKVFALGYDLYKDKMLYNKSDSSIGGGVEVVTSPIDRKSIPILFDKMKDMFEYVNTKNYKENAGLHIHVSKDSIPVQDRYKLCLLLNNSDVTKKERKIMYFLSGRVENLNTEVNDHYYEIGTRSGWICDACGHDKALNTSNSTTYEFRIFKSSADKDILMSYVVLTDCMLEFCNTHGLKDITISNFIQWLKLNSKNKIIKDKISFFEESEGKIIPISKIVEGNDLIKYLNGIRWEDYCKLVTAIQTYTTVRKIITKYNECSEAKKATGRNVELQEKLLNTYRKTAINYILKNQERIETECA